ncbi:hypothetical protein PV08_00018 [Exophiala spinifera]|uniref:C2H2-type domain-containing protein n=1 Tax=Exophiala spinifera TaxID=91928 RepID=A0A0D1YVZ9_9EURO|nr:uncharacterized protein PV08_00018 [Exophiala spinifera]KIW19446.1 hypothetical protein PV08_00018 [Exophiala spinifera]
MDSVGIAPAPDPDAGSKRSSRQCPHCQRLFSKPEHLKRHERIHSGSKPFVCPNPDCQRRFNRLDSLARHRKTHHAADKEDVSVSSVLESPIHPVADPLVPAMHTPIFPVDLQLDSQSLTALFSDSVPTDTAVDPSSHEPYSWAGLSEDIFTEFFSLDNDQHFCSSQLLLNAAVTALGEPSGDSGPSDAASTHARQALGHLKRLVSEFSHNLSGEVEATGVPVHFLEVCLGCFFSQFLRIFPVMHEQTFSLKRCTPTLLLSMVAIGSLFVAGDSAATMGEALWRVVHAAVATSWQSFSSTSPEDEQITGMQLVLTALLSQAYAVLSSNGVLKHTSLALRGQGLHWARHFNLFTSEEKSERPIFRMNEASRTDMWRSWAAAEGRRRALFGHYILDGLIAQSCGLPNTALHTINNVAMPCSDEMFDASSADEWVEIAGSQDLHSTLTCRQLLLDLFNFDVEPSKSFWPHFAVPVVLEALQSLITETAEAAGPSIGLPTRPALSRALWRLFDSQITRRLPVADASDLSVRWHTVCINFCVETRNIIGGLCRKYNIELDRYHAYGGVPDTKFDVDAWRGSHHARRAMLHAFTILDLVKQLPVVMYNTLHLPSALYTAAIILIATVPTDSTRCQVPRSINWREVCEFNVEGTSTASVLSPTSEYLQSGTLKRGARHDFRNTLVDFNTLQTMLDSTGPKWRITKEMHQTLAQLMAARQEEC